MAQEKPRDGVTSVGSLYASAESRCMCMVVCLSRMRNSLLMLLTGSALAFGTLSSIATGNVTLAWDANPDPSVAGYKLYYGTTSGSYGTVISAGTATTATASNLTEGATYYFAATDYDTNGFESDFSTEVAYTVPIISS